MHIYNNELEYQATIPHDSETINQHGIEKIYPPFQKDWWLTETKFNYPKLENGELVEKTKYDLYLNNLYKLQDGEIVKGNDIITVHVPNNLLKPLWKNMEWVESATLEEIEEFLRNKIINVNDELTKIRVAGFNKFSLETELETLRGQHMEITHQIAMKGVK